MTTPAPIDEMVDGRGRVRPHWQGVLAAFADLPEGGLADRCRRLDRAFEDEGISSMLPGPGSSQAWRCDPVPLPLPAAEFDALAEGLAQRARVLEALIADLHGEQRLLREGLLPPSLVFANPGFLRPCHRPGSPQRRPMLQSYAADLVRGPDGQWRVLNDRTSRAAGIGHVHENRRILSRLMPDAFRGQMLRPLRPFFEAWQDALHREAPPMLSGARSPAIALLTPGTSHPHWFEHMLLSRELSCALVEAGDLTVRGGFVFLKTLRGLQPVDVLLRRQEGRFLDPLEFGGNGNQGVPGLMDAARHGNIRIVNDPASGVAEAPGLVPFLPVIARRLFGEDLALASVPTLWLEDLGARARVLGDPDAWMIRSATDGMAHAEELQRMAPAEKAALLAKVSARPRNYVATQVQPCSLAPTANQGRLEPQPVMLRLFLLNDGDGWRAMPGGLARIVTPGTPLTGRLPRHGIAKDVWVLSEERNVIIGPSAMNTAPMPIRRAAGELPSRIADNLFWLGRYVERLEGAARLMRAALSRIERGLALPRESAELAAIARCLREAMLIEAEDLPSGGGTAQLSRALHRAAAEGGALHVLAGHVFRLVESVRDRLTGDIYAAFTLPLRAARADALAGGAGAEGLSHALSAILRYSAGVAGVAAENMVRGGGFTFLDLGRRLERAMAVTGQLAAALDQPASRLEGGLRLALELCDSVITYRTRYTSVLQAGPVLDLVLADPGNPRGLAFQCSAIYDLLSDLGGEDRSLAERAAGLHGLLETMSRDVVIAADQTAAASLLAGQLTAFGNDLAALSDIVSRHYFALLPATRTLGSEEPVQLALQGAA